MKKKRLNRDSWGFQGFPYYQMRIDCEFFHGMVCMIKLLDGETQYWRMPNAGKSAVCGKGMTWLQLIPDGTSRVITTMYYENGKVPLERYQYPDWARKAFCPSVWYIDVMENIEYDTDGVIIYVDKYLDVIFSPEGDLKVDDRDELDDAYAKGDITKMQYDAALMEGDRILKELCVDIPKTAKWCADIRAIVEQKIKEGYQPMKVGNRESRR